MRIAKISITKLFGIFDYEVPLNLEDRITVIYGPNGCGKTVLLEAIHALFVGRYEKLAAVPWKTLSVDFDDGGRFTITKRDGREGFLLAAVEYTPPNGERQTESEFWLMRTSLRQDTSDAELQYRVPGLARVTTRSWLYEPTGELLDHGELVDRFPDRLEDLRDEGWQVPWMVQLMQSVGVHLIGLRRLLTYAPLSPGRAPEGDEERLSLVSTLERYSEQLKGSIQAALAEDDASKTSTGSDQLARRLDLLATMINSRFLYKQLYVSKEDGLFFRTSSGADLNPNSLSSGEQQQLLLLYELIFRLEKGTLVLIDEPELSLHVYWQQLFLKDLQKIARLAELDFIVATHSPQIIHDRWDLAVELKGPE